MSKRFVDKRIRLPFFKITLLLVLVIIGGYYCFVQLSGFSPKKILSDFSEHPDWNTSPSLSDHSAIEKVLDQPFFYLGKGVQCYAFISQDGTTVLKFFKHYHMWPDNIFL